MSNVLQTAEQRQSTLRAGGIVLGLGTLLIMMASVAGIRAAERDAMTLPTATISMPMAR